MLLLILRLVYNLTRLSNFLVFDNYFFVRGILIDTGPGMTLCLLLQPNDFGGK